MMITYYIGACIQVFLKTFLKTYRRVPTPIRNCIRICMWSLNFTGMIRWIKITKCFLLGSQLVQLCAFCFVSLVLLTYMYKSPITYREEIAVVRQDFFNLKQQRDLKDVSETFKKKEERLENFVNEICEFERTRIAKGENLPLLTLFTTWVSSPERRLCHNNTINNWQMLRPFVEPVLFTNDNDLIKLVSAKGWNVLRVSKFNIGIPVLKNMYVDAMKHFKTRLYGYANSDILFTKSLIVTLLKMSDFFDSTIPFLIIGRRTDILNVTESEASSFDSLKQIANERGRAFTTWGEDYFITPPSYPWNDIPELVVGRKAYDNWLVANANIKQFPTIDTSSTNLAIHQSTVFDNYHRSLKRYRSFNHYLLRKLKKLVDYGGGLTSSARYYTRFNESSIVLESRYFNYSNMSTLSLH